MTRPIRFSIWFSIIILAAFAAGYSAWAKATLNWPFDKVFYPYPEKHRNNAAQPPPSLRGGEAKLDIADWKTYRNEEYGFEFRYPPNWKLNAANNSVNISDMDITIDILLTRVNSKSVIDATKGIGTELLYPLVDLSEGKVLFAGVNAERISYSVNGRLEKNIIPLKLNPTIRIILRQDDNISNQILSTFKFIK